MAKMPEQFTVIDAVSKVPRGSRFRYEDACDLAEDCATKHGSRHLVVKGEKVISEFG